MRGGILAVATTAREECIMDHAERDSLNDDDNDLLEDVYRYLTVQQYKDGLNPNQKRVVRKKANNFYIVDGEMIFKKKQRGNIEVARLSYIA